MSKMTQIKSMDYIKKDYVKTRTMPGSWYLSSYKYKFNITHLKPYLDKLKEKKLVGNQCSGCNRTFFPPRLVCGKCLLKPDKWVDIRDTARVSTFAIAFVKNEETGKVEERPMVLINHDGSDTSSLAELNPELEAKDTYVGMPVKLHWREETTGGLMDIEYYDLMDDHSKDMDTKE